jgi:CBS domain-containing protein
VTETDTQIYGSFLTPTFENATVSDAMRRGVIACPPETPLKTVARMMADNHVHSIVVARGEADGGRSWGMVSDIDVVRAGEEAEESTAGQACATTVVTVGPDEALARAAQLMAEHELSHLLVVDLQSDRPVGVLSTLDVAGIIAWGRA